jgi:hypothetical protein
MNEQFTARVTHACHADRTEVVIEMASLTAAANRCRALPVE